MKTTLASTLCGLVVCSAFLAPLARAADDSVQISGALGTSSPGHVSLSPGDVPLPPGHVSLRGGPTLVQPGRVHLSATSPSDSHTVATDSRRRAGRASYNHVDSAQYVIQRQDPLTIGSGGYEERGVGYAVAAPFGPLIGLEGVFGTGPGFGDYYRGGLFLPRFMNNGNSLFFLSINGAATADKGDGIGNFGAGYRVLSEELQRIFTVAGFFDIDDGHSDTFYRAGVSAESLGKYLDFRVNADFVVGDDSNSLFNGFTGTPFFQKNFLVVNRRRITENAFSSIDYEVGGPLPFLARFGVSQYVGGYHYYSDNDDDIDGVKLRTEVAVTDDLTVNVNWTHDTLFGSNTYVSVALSLPNGRSQRRFRKRRIRDRLSQRIQRTNRIPTHVRTTNTPTPLTNPADGMPFFFVHVDPDAGAPGNGMFETPFSTLEASRLANVASNDILYVRPRADGSGTNLAVTSSLLLFNNQRLLASNISHSITATQGTFTIPMIGSGGTGPFITNSSAVAGSVLTLMNNNEVSGFTIDGSALHNGIMGQPVGVGVNGFNINRNTIQNGVNGIMLADAFGTGRLSQNIISGHTTDGAQITLASANTLNLTATANSFLTNGGIGLNASATTGTATVTIGGSAVADGNTASGNSGDGVRVTASGTSTLTSVLVANNTLTGNTGAGLQVIATGGGDILNGRIHNNSASTNGTGMILTATGAGSTFTVPDLSSNSITNNTGSGAQLSALSGGALTLAAPVMGGPAGFVNNTLTGNGADGVLGTADGAGSALTLNLGALPFAGATSLPNTISSNTGNGIALTASNTGTLTGGIINNVASSNTLAGLNLQALSGGLFGATPAAPFTVTNNTINSNQNTGITAVVDGATGATNSTMNLVIGGVPATSGNILTANVDAGIWIRGRTTGVLRSLSVQGNTITGTTDNVATTGVNNPAGDGIFVDREDNADFGFTGGLGSVVIGNNTTIAQTGRGNTVTGNAGSGIRLYAIGANLPGVNTLLFDGNTLMGNTVDGFGADLFANSQFLIANQGNTFDSNTGFGIRLVTNQNAALGNSTTGTASTFLADTFLNNTAGQFTTTANNNSFQNIRIGSTASTRTTMTGGGGNAITIVNNSTFSGGVPTPNKFQIDGTDIDLQNGGSDGINITASGTGGTTAVIGTTVANQNVTITKAGDDGIDYSQTAGSNTLTISKTAVSSNAGDGIKILQSNGSLTTTITGSSANANAGRGLDIDVQRAVAVAGTDDAGSNFIIGGSAAGLGNTFNNNVQQGVVFRTLTSVGFSGTALLAGDATVGNLYQDITSPAAVISNLTFVGNNVQFNGNATSLVDGMALEVGTSTRLDAIINSNTFGGNVLADLNVIAIVSVNPTGVSVNDEVTGPPTQDRVALDPTALLNLALGVNAVQGGGGPAPTTSLGNTGEMFTINTQGSATALVGSSNAGQFTNADIFKPTLRAVSGVFNVFTSGLIEDSGAPDAAPFNVFRQAGIDQSIQTVTLPAANVTIGTGFTGGSSSINIIAPSIVFP